MNCRSLLIFSRNLSHLLLKSAGRTNKYKWQLPFPRVSHTIGCSIILRYSQTKAGETSDIYETVAKHLNEPVDSLIASIDSNINVKKASKNDLETIFKILEEHHVTKRALRKNLFILDLSPMEVKMKLELLKRLPFSINKALPLVKLEPDQIRDLQSSHSLESHLLGGKNRVQWLCDKFQFSEEDVLKSVAKFPFFIYIQIQRLQIVVNILLDYEVDKSNILNDFWIFRTSVKVMINRFEFAKKAGMTNIKTWMSRCPESVLQKAIERQIKNNKVAPGSQLTVAEYLCTRFQSDESSKNMIHFIANKKHPQLNRMNLFRVKEITDFLFSKGYTSNDILLWPRIFFAKTKTIDDRMREYRRIGIEKPKLVQLCKSRKQYEQELKYYSNKLDSDSTNS